MIRSGGLRLRVVPTWDNTVNPRIGRSREPTGYRTYVRDGAGLEWTADPTDLETLGG